ncbi:hypothetical protein K440DRAFT_683204 [Wilcoxina mikolae CBS 423.85]|nr:hypothetical protein K440DRAFT_683204 [Wilcoxina mikolae CBS 423.85]
MAENRALEDIIRDNLQEHQFGVLSNPLINLTWEQLRRFGRQFAEDCGLNDYVELFADAAVLVQNLHAARRIRGSLPDSGTVRSIDTGSPEEILEVDAKDDMELTLELKGNLLSKLNQQPRKLYLVVFVCAGSATVQGWDQ